MQPPPIKLNLNLQPLELARPFAAPIAPAAAAASDGARAAAEKDQPTRGTTRVNRKLLFYCALLTISSSGVFCSSQAGRTLHATRGTNFADAAVVDCTVDMGKW